MTSKYWQQKLTVNFWYINWPVSFKLKGNRKFHPDKVRHFYWNTCSVLTMQHLLKRTGPKNLSLKWLKLLYFFQATVRFPWWLCQCFASLAWWVQQWWYTKSHARTHLGIPCLQMVMNSNGFKTRDRSILVQEELKRNNRLDRAKGDLGGAILISAYKNQNKT